MDVSVRKITSLILRRHNSCTCKNMPCMCYMVTTRDVGDIPGCVPTTRGHMFLIDQNINVDAVGTAEEYVLLCEARSRECSNKYSHLEDDAIVRMIANLGKIRPVA